MGLLDRITDRIAEKAAKRAFEVGIDTLGELMKDEEKRDALLKPAWDYFDKRINLKIANLTSGREEIPGGVALPAGGLGALSSFLPPGLAQFTPLLGMIGGGTGGSPPSLPAPTSGNGHTPGMRR